MARPTYFCRGRTIGADSSDRRDHKLSSPSHRIRRESAIVLFFVIITGDSKAREVTDRDLDGTRPWKYLVATNEELLHRT